MRGPDAATYAQGSTQVRLLVSSGIVLILFFFTFGLGYYAGERKLALPPFLREYIPVDSPSLEKQQPIVTPSIDQLKPAPSFSGPAHDRDVGPLPAAPQVEPVLVPAPPSGPAPGEDKYTLPAGATTAEFVRCLQSLLRPLQEGRDFRIKEFSPLVRVVVPISPDYVVSEGYEACRLKFKR